ncbi:hypothetical protein ACROYT_G018237 [Oculina patagonica]
MQQVQRNDEADEGEIEEPNPEAALLDNTEMQRVQGNDEADDGEIDEPNPEAALLDNTEMQRGQGNDEADDGEIEEPDPEDALLDDTQVPLGVEETLDSPLPTGTQDTEPPGPHSSTGFKPVQGPRTEPSCDKHSHTKIQKTTIKETTVCITCAPAKGCRCQL